MLVLVLVCQIELCFSFLSVGWRRGFKLPLPPPFLKSWVYSEFVLVWGVNVTLDWESVSGGLVDAWLLLCVCCHSVGEAALDETDVDPCELFVAMGMLVLESRLPTASVKGRRDGLHCPQAVGHWSSHECDLTQSQVRWANPWCIYSSSTKPLSHVNCFHFTCTNLGGSAEYWGFCVSVFRFQPISTATLRFTEFRRHLSYLSSDSIDRKAKASSCQLEKYKLKQFIVAIEKQSINYVVTQQIYIYLY